MLDIGYQACAVDTLFAIADKGEILGQLFDSMIRKIIAHGSGYMGMPAAGLKVMDTGSHKKR